MGHFYHQPLLSPFLLLFAPGSGRPALGCSLRCRWRWSTSHGPPQQAFGASGGSFCPFGLHGTPKNSWVDVNVEIPWNSSCVFLFFPHFHAFFGCDLRFSGASSHGLFCCVWLPVFTVMIYYDILHVLIVLAHIRSICQFVHSQRIIPIGNSVGWCFKSRWLCRYAGVFFAEALRVFNQGCSILL